MKQHVFITGTDTDVGKTFVAATLASGLGQLDQPVAYWKPVQSGAPYDADTVGPHAHKVIPTSFLFSHPQSPDQAALKEAATAATIPALLHRYRELADESHLIVEGAGGLHVPLNEQNETWEDFLKDTRLPVVLVARTSLGTLNHTSLSLTALKRMDADVRAVVLSGEAHPENLHSLQRMHPDITFLHLPHLADGDSDPAWPEHAKTLAKSVFTPATTTASTSSDEAHVWHPYTQHKTSPAPIGLERASGVWLHTNKGEKLLDGISSWWVNTVGHGRPEIGEAIHAQQAKMDHVIFAGATHTPAVTLANKVTALLGSGLSRVFYSDNGSTAVEVGLKMAFQSWTNRGVKHRRSFLSFRGSYHGDTFGTMSVGDTDQFHSAFQALTFDTIFADPVTRHPSQLAPHGSDDAAENLERLEKLLIERHESLAGVLIEPLVQGAGGMLMQPEAWLRDMVALCRRFSLPIIFDEVFTGFGRTGSTFAFQRAGVTPDIICLSKAITGGTMPLALTVANDCIYEAFLGDDMHSALLHGHSYTANPISCACALATLGIYERESLVERGRALEDTFQTWITEEGPHLPIANARTVGGILAFELSDTGYGSYHNTKGKEVAARAQQAGLFIRPLGNTVYLVPPLSITEEETAWALDKLAASLKG